MKDSGSRRTPEVSLLKRTIVESERTDPVKAVSPLYFAFFAWVFVGSRVLSLLRYPSCGTSVAFQWRVADLPIYAVFVLRKSQNGGYDLTRADD
jgi:hypothetical protein